MPCPGHWAANKSMDLLPSRAGGNSHASDSTCAEFSFECATRTIDASLGSWFPHNMRPMRSKSAHSGPKSTEHTFIKEKASKIRVDSVEHKVKLKLRWHEPTQHRIVICTQKTRNHFDTRLSQQRIESSSQISTVANQALEC